MFLKVLFLQQFLSNLYMLYTKIIVYSYEIYIFFFGRKFSITGCPWISSAILILKIGAEIKKWPLILQKWQKSKKDTGCPKNQKCCYSQKTYGPTCFITQYTIQDKNDRFGLCFSSMVAKIHLQGVQQWNLTTFKDKFRYNFSCHICLQIYHTI